jgi:hypothetical protein
MDQQGSFRRAFKRPYIEDLDSSIEQLLAKEIELKEYSEIMISEPERNH